jgi:GNAT superfamily N-acetyltransferase
MLRTTSPGAAAHPTIRRVETVADMDAFATVQGRGFGEDDAADITAWAPFMSAADHRNRTNPGQDFFVDHDGPNPVACALTVYAASLAGIYAVATVPPARKQGRATALLNHAAAAAAARGFSILGLQTETGSDAERLYRREGFETLFEMRVFRTA